MRAVSMEMARLGYLTSPDGRHLRHVIGLDRMARDADEIGATIVWADIRGDCPGLCLCRERCIILAPWLFRAVPFFLRRVLAEELGHCVMGPSDDRAISWQERYDRLLVWEEWI